MPEAGARRRSRRSSPESAASQPPKRWAPWVLPLVAGLAFGSGYAITDRLLALQAKGPLKLDQGFDLKPFPGTTLESLRLRYGADRQELRGDLELIELERTQQEEKAKREAAQKEGPKPEARRPQDEGAASGSASDPAPASESAASRPSEAASDPGPPALPAPPSLNVPPPPAPERQP